MVYHLTSLYPFPISCNNQGLAILKQEPGILSSSTMCVAVAKCLNQLQLCPGIHWQEVGLEAGNPAFKPTLKQEAGNPTYG